jgi:hypothetical protein
VFCVCFGVGLFCSIQHIRKNTRHMKKRNDQINILLSFILSIHLRLYSPLLDIDRFFSFLICFTQSVGLLRRGISPSQGRYLRTGQYKHRMKAHTDIHASSGIRTHDPSIRAVEDGSCLRPRGHCDRLSFVLQL